MATQLDIRDLGWPLADMVQRASHGDEITISDNGRTIARIVPAISPDRDTPESIATPASGDDNPRLAIWGMWKEKVWMSDDFDAPLSEEELQEWEK